MKLNFIWSKGYCYCGGGGVVDRNVDNVYVTVLRLADWLYAIVL